MSGIIAQNVGRHTGLVKAPSAAGEWTLIKTLTASGDDTLSFVDGTSDVVLDSTYDEYCFKFINIHPETGESKLTFQANAAGGSGYDETITSTTFYPYHGEDGGGGALYYDTGIDQAQGTAFQAISDPIGGGNDESASGYLYLYGISSTTFVKHWHSRVSVYHAGPNNIAFAASGYFNTASAIDEFQFKMHRDAIDLGTISLYGIG